MKKLIRTEKEFSKENLSLDFLRRATAIGGLHGRPLHFNMDDFEIEEKWKGVHSNGSSVSPWNDEEAKMGYVKVRSSVWLKNKTSFDTNVVIHEEGMIHGYFKESGNRNFAGNPIEWCNLLLEYGFLKFDE